MNDTPASAVTLSNATPVDQVEPLMTPDQVQEWLSVSRWWIDKYSAREDDPLPWIGTKRIRRMRQADLLAWLTRNRDVA